MSRLSMLGYAISQQELQFLVRVSQQLVQVMHAWASAWPAANVHKNVTRYHQVTNSNHVIIGTGWQACISMSVQVHVDWQADHNRFECFAIMVHISTAAPDGAKPCSFKQQHVVYGDAAHGTAQRTTC